MPRQTLRFWRGEAAFLARSPRDSQTTLIVCRAHPSPGASTRPARAGAMSQRVAAGAVAAAVVAGESKLRVLRAAGRGGCLPLRLLEVLDLRVRSSRHCGGNREHQLEARRQALLQQERRREAARAGRAPARRARPYTSRGSDGHSKYVLRGPCGHQLLTMAHTCPPPSTTRHCPPLLCWRRDLNYHLNYHCARPCRFSALTLV